MRILVLAKYRFSLDESTYWLVDDLVEYLDSRGHSVIVYYLDILGEYQNGEYTKHSNTKVFCYSYGNNRGYLSKLKHTLKAFFYFYKLCKKSSFDIALNFTLFSAFYPLIKFLSYGGTRMIGIVWDFYPHHSVSIGKMRRGLIARIMYLLESSSFRTMDKLCFMSSANRDFANRYIRGLSAIESEIIVLWRTIRAENERRRLDKQHDSYLVVIFGGQLVAGRGIDQLLEASKLVEEDVRFRIFGSGSEYDVIEKKIHTENISNVELSPSVSRDTYMDEIAKAHIGLVVTVEADTVSFPSKFLDYCTQAIPIIAAVEEMSDFDEFVVKKARCGYSTPVGDSVALARLLDKCAKNKNELVTMGEKGYQYYKANLQTHIVARGIVGDE